MEKLRNAVKEIAYAQNHAKLSTLHHSLIPFLSLSSSLYRIALSIRRFLYHSGIFAKHRLPVPVISVGNLTWGGNGKTPMVEFIAKHFADCGISPLILTRGYAGGDEAKMLNRHLVGGPARIGVGANRAATADFFLKKYGYMDRTSSRCSDTTRIEQKVGSHIVSQKIGVVVLDDGMQHWSLCRDLEIVMVNGIMPWGNRQLLPLGPLREPLTALKRADVAVVHHADLISQQKLKSIESAIKEIKETLPIFHTRMSPSHFFPVDNIDNKINLNSIGNSFVLCVSAIGSPDAFVQQIKKIGARCVDRLDFSDHHSFESSDIEMMRMRLRQLEDKFGHKPVLVITEKDYDRDPEILRHLNPYEVLVLCSELQFMSENECSEDEFKLLLRKVSTNKFD